MPNVKAAETPGEEIVRAVPPLVTVPLGWLNDIVKLKFTVVW